MMKYQISNIKYQNYKSKIKNFLNFTLSFCILLFTFLILSLQPIYALESTPSADIKSKLEELKKEIASKAAQLKQEVGRKLKDKTYAGKVKSKSDNSLTLAAPSGPKIVSINQDTVFESLIKSKQKLSQKSISLEDNVAALGDADETGVLIARKIVLLPNAKSEKPKTFLWGQIVSTSDKLVTLKDKNSKNITARLPASSKAKINDTVILTGSMDENDIFDTGFVYVMSQGVNLKPKKTATPSAKVASPSAKSTLPSAKPAVKKTN